MEVFLSASSMHSISIPLGTDFYEYVAAFINTVNNTVLYNRNSLRPLGIFERKGISGYKVGLSGR